MSEPLTVELVADMLRTLAAAFPGRAMDDRQLMLRAEVYYNNLQGLSGNALRWAVKISIQEDQYFPKVARLRELATRWISANTAATVGPRADDRYCKGCGQAWAPETRWRPKPRSDGSGQQDITPDGEWLILESYSRDRCRCDAPPTYQPSIEAPPGLEAMRVRRQSG